ncbi:FecR domain-containing protein [Echinicola marina]|uniref:FecR family protein n=1 Tax=Echinicola marina TaxID=2859768 RepID=UPI001CF66A1D|nr:FecR family protein [Echinicola marina]UCS95457.1 FecR domain-containing protein [Echinicola marina]
MQFDPQTEKDFLLNEHFVQWIMAPDHESDRYWSNWLQKNPGKANLMKRAKESVQGLTLRTFEIDEDDSELILDRIIRHHNKTKDGLTERSSAYVLLDFLMANRVAAVLVLVTLFLGLLTLDFQPETPSEIKNEKIEWLTKSSKAGTKMTFHLPDGSLVKLNSNSSISFPESFSDSLREVKLIGQAFFDVEHNEELPFVVAAGDLQIKVMGTSFDVNNKPENKAQKVALLSGKVKVITADGMIEQLSPLEMVSYRKSDNELVKVKFDPEEVMGWKDGIIKFENTDHKEVFKILEEWYDVKIQVEDNVKFKGGINGRYENEILDNVLKGLSYSENFKYKIENKKVTIFKI